MDFDIDDGGGKAGPEQYGSLNGYAHKWAIRTSPDDRFVYSCGRYVGLSVSRSDVITGALLASSPSYPPKDILSPGSDNDFTALAVSPDGGVLYVTERESSPGNSKVRLFSASSLMPLPLEREFSGKFEGIAVSKDGATLYVTRASSNEVLLLDAGDLSTLSSVPIAEASGISVSANGEKVYMTHLTAGTVSVRDAETLSLLQAVSVSGSPTDVVESPDGRLLCVSHDQSDPFLTLYDAETYALLNSISGFSIYGKAVAVALAGKVFGSFIDHTGVLYTAVSAGTSIRVARFKNGTASRELLATIPDSRNPSLFKIDGKIYLAYTERSGGIAKISHSPDGAKTFSMPITIWDSTYKNAVVAPLISGGAASVSISDKKVYFKRTNDLQNWDTTPVAIAPLGDSAIAHIHQKSISGSTDLIATNGTALARSRDGGKTWTAL